MTRLNQYFKREEFECPDCGKDTVDAELLQVLTDLRVHCGQPITVNSGARCEKHNQDIGASKFSQHLLSKAADIVVREFSSTEVYHLLDKWHPDKYGIGLYDNFVHIDVRKNRARWEG